MSPSSLVSQAATAHSRGQLAEAAALCKQALETDPDNIQAMLLLGVVGVKSGDPNGAIGPLEQVQKQDPRSFQAPFWLSVAYRNLEQPAKAIKAAEAAYYLNPNDPQGLAQVGACCLDVRLLPEAEEYLRKAASMAPNVVQLACSLSQCLMLQGRATEAQTVLKSALDRARPNADQLVGLGQVLLNQEYAAGAAVLGQRAVALAPQSAKARLLLARALTESDSAAAAIEHLQVAIELEPSNAEAVAMLGSALQSIGRIEEASALFRKSCQLEPNQGYSYFALLHNRKATEADRPLLAQMQELADQPQLASKQLSYLSYALGKAHEDLCEFEDAMCRYDDANRIEYDLKFRGRPYDREEAAAKTDRIIRTFDQTTLSAHAKSGSTSPLPIFVVGMMRSGTTLAEQILSSHPNVGAAGEQHFWPDNSRQGMNSMGTEVKPEALPLLAARYCALLSEIAPGKERVVDKLPGNSFGLGLLHLALPAARVIHMRRHPADTCLSIYTTPNRARPEFAHNRENIVFAYRQYLRIMEHWRSVLPPDSILEVSYEELVTDGERITRKMIDFCGLEWNENCLNPERNERSVVTPSVWQVRQPIYKTSTERWRRFEPWLGAFQDLL